VLAVVDKNLNEKPEREAQGLLPGEMMDEVELSQNPLAQLELNPEQQRSSWMYGSCWKEPIPTRSCRMTTTSQDGFQEVLYPRPAEGEKTVSPQIPINYRVILKDGAWKVYDVVIENVSLIQNYRSQLNSILSKNTPDQMIEILKEKVKGKG
jgi:hypothetical protein